MWRLFLNLPLCYLRGGLASVAITTNLPTGLWNLNRPSNLSLGLLTIIYSAIHSGSRLYVYIFVWWTWHSCSQDFFRRVCTDMAYPSKNRHLPYLYQHMETPEWDSMPCGDIIHSHLPQFEQMWVGESESHFISVAFYVSPALFDPYIWFKTNS